MIGNNDFIYAYPQSSLLFSDRQAVPSVSEISYGIIALDNIVDSRNRGFLIIQKS